MSNNVDNKAPKMYKPEELVAETQTTTMGLPVKGTIFTVSSNELVAKMEEILINSLCIDQVDGVLMDIITQNGNVTEIHCYAVMNLNDAKPGTSMIALNRAAGGSYKGGDGRTRIGNVMPISGRNNLCGGKYIFGPDFTSKLGSIAVLDNDDNIVVTEAPGGGRNNKVALVELDFFKMMCVGLDVSDDDPFDWSLISADPLGGDNYSLMFTKFIVNKKIGKRKGGGANIDYTAIKRGLGFGGGNRRGNGGRRF